MSFFSDPFEKVVNVTPSDTDLLALGKPKALFITTVGTLSGLQSDGTTATWTADELTANGPVFPWRPIRINATGTTAVVRALY